MSGAGDARPRQPGRRSHSAALPETRFDREHLDIAIGWLLRSNRVLGRREELRQLTAFSTAFASCGMAAGPSTVSRWETGAQPVPYSAVRRYEQLLGLEPSMLVSTIDLLHRYFATDLPTAPALARPVAPLDVPTHAALADTVDRVHLGAPVTGQQWDEFSAAMCAVPNILLPRPSTAEEMAGRLLSEMIIADGVAWMQRYEAFCRLAAHPLFAEAAVDACARLARDPRNQVFVETVCALDASDHPDAAGHVLEQLQDPTNDRAFLGALEACVRKTRFGHFAPDQAIRLAGLLGDLIADPGAQPSTRRLARRLLARLHQHPRSRPAVSAVQLGERLARPPSLASAVSEETEQVIGRIQDGAAAPFRDDSRLVDRTVPELVRAALLDPVSDQRLYVGMLLRASPYRTAVADACLAQLTAAPADLIGAMLSLSRILGQHEHAPAFERLVTDPTRPAEVRQSAAFALGHVQVGADRSVWDRLLLPSGPDGQAGEGFLAGLVYSAGIAGHHELLSRVPGQRLPSDVRRAVEWWRDMPRSVLESARS